jgi:hypothetical protein
MKATVEGRAMSDDCEKEVLRRTLEHERGTWREDLRTRFAPWFDQAVWGFRCHDGWSGIIAELTAEIARIVGGPEGAPELRVVEVKEKLGGLRYYIWHVPEKHALAVAEAKQRAEDRSFETCEVCGKPGKLVRSDGYWHTACLEHENL